MRQEASLPEILNAFAVRCAGKASGRNGPRGSMGPIVWADRAVLPQGGRWTAADRSGKDATHLLPPARVQPVAAHHPNPTLSEYRSLLPTFEVTA